MTIFEQQDTEKKSSKKHRKCTINLSELKVTVS